MNNVIVKVRHFLGQPESQKNAIISYFFSGIMLLLIMLFPVGHYYEQNKQHFLDEQKISQWLMLNNQQLKQVALEHPGARAASKPDARASTNKSLLAIISDASKKQMPARIDQRGEAVVVSVDRAPLPVLLAWLDELATQHSVEISSTSINHIENNTVSAQITFTR